MIYLEHVTKIYEDTKTTALSDVSLRVERGEFVFVTGKSGSGKSTLIRLLIKELEATKGRISINGTALSGLKDRGIPAYRRTLGVVFQDMRLFDDRDVFGNVAFAREIVNPSRKDISRRVTAVLSLLGLTDLYKRSPQQLSGGEKQKVALARAIVNDPMVVLADEPTGNLDPQSSAEVMDLFDRINKRGVTVLVATHDIEQVERLGHRRVVLEEGRICRNTAERQVSRRI